MAQSLVQQYQLMTLQISLDRSGMYARKASLSPAEGPSQDVAFTLRVGDEMHGHIVVPAAELDIPNDLQKLRMLRAHDLKLRLPDDLLPAVQALAQLGPKPGQPLWITFSDTCGNLPLMPWERTLQPLLGVPLLRLPKYALQPVVASETLDVVLCASVPDERRAFPVPEVLDTLVRCILESVPRQIVIHVFAEQPFWNELTNRLGDLISTSDQSRHVQIYNPAEAGTPDPQQTSAPTTGGSAWLRWVKRALRGRSTDIVHFVAPGHLWGDQGTLAWATDPLADAASARATFLAPQQLDAFRTQLGAAAVGLTLPPKSHGLPFLRLLAYQLDHLRPGSVLLHDMTRGDQTDTIGAAYRCLYGIMPASAPAVPTITLFCHPALFEPPAQATLPPQHPDVLGAPVDRGLGETTSAPVPSVLGDYTLAEGPTLDLLTSKANTPGWLAASQRYLERAAADLADDEPDAQSPAAQGKAEGLKALSELIAQHALSGQKGKEKT